MVVTWKMILLGVDTIVCDAATIQLAQQCNVMHYDTSKMDRYTDLGLPSVQLAPVKCKK